MPETRFEKTFLSRFILLVYHILEAIIDVFLTPEKYIHPSTGKPYSDEILGYVEEEKKTMI